MGDSFFGKFTIQVLEKTEDGWYIAEVVDPNGNHCHTQGRNKEEIIVYAADVILCLEEIKVHWWNRFLSKFFIYKKD